MRNRQLGRTAALVLVMLTATGMLAQQSKTPPAKSATAVAVSPEPAKSQSGQPEAKPAKETRAPDGREEGINVHGHWTIEVRNPDGSLASRHEFENAIDAGGMWTLTTILTRKGTVQEWMVSLITTGTACPPSVSAAQCDITEPAPEHFGNTSYTLTVSVPASGDKVILNGSATASGTGQIIKVMSTLYYCSPDHATGTCAMITPTGQAPLGFGAFTSAVPQPISVQAGQTINVTVSLGFS